jgi:hypothetical protein
VIESSPRERFTRRLVLAGIVAALLAVNVPTLVSAAEKAWHNYQINSQGYKQRMGHWSILAVPQKLRIDAIHAALLYTGKVLIVAGSGNNEGDFKAGTFKSILWDPATNKFKLIHTPSDMFCGGHAFLPDGRLLIAGGTARYEKLEDKITHAAGVMTIQNWTPAGKPVKLPAGSEFISPGGVAYRTTEAARIVPARKRLVGGVAKVSASDYEVWVEALDKGKASVLEGVTHFKITGVASSQAHATFGIATALTMHKQDFWGNNRSFLFNPANESYERVSNLQIARWYPTLVGLKDGRVLAVSGLDQFGRMIQGKNEIYSPASKAWKVAPALTRVFPTYPALFLMPEGNLFYTGSNAGYGSTTVGRIPGVWNLQDNSFKEVAGLKDPTETETSGSMLLPPAQEQKYMIAGGGGVGDSPKSTARTAIVDLARPQPKWQEGPRLAQPTRYPEMVITPDDRVIITGGSRYYRGAHASDLFECHSFDPASGKLSRLADPDVGRDYHAEALLLPNGEIVTLGGNPLYGNKADTTPGYFQQKIEIYSPPYLYHGPRPQIAGAPREATLASTIRLETPQAAQILTARLIRPSAVTHVTDPEQRSIALTILSRERGAIQVSVPAQRGLVPAGWYMLFLTNRRATPSVAHWIHIS